LEIPSDEKHVCAKRMNPIFLISLPRAGSTLLQRMLMSHPKITSKSEPWIMLPFVYLLNPEGMVTEYNHQWANTGVHDYIQSLPNGRQDYEKLLREFVTNLYRLNCTNHETYFLDKTPRYYLIIRELSEIFPEAKFIFLTRNPLQVISSIITTFSNNTLRNLHFYHIDFFQGFRKIDEGITLLGNRAVHVKYEDLVSQPNEVLIKIFGFLNVPWDDNLTHTLDDQGLQGRLGDKWGTYQYNTIEDKSINKWKNVLNEYVRKIYVSHIISDLDEKILVTHGYTKSELLNEVAELKTRISFQSVQDLVDILRSRLIRFFYFNLYRKRVRSWTKNGLPG
jgi:hypothetical protein